MTLKNSIFSDLILLTIMSFKAFEPKTQLQLKTGTYGTCGCSDQSDMKVELTIEKDSTFNYYHHTGDVNKIIDVTGKWTREGNTIILKDFNSTSSVPAKWQIDENEKCLKTRNGMAWTRLCLTSECK
jgi:hypothetical protein